MTGPDKTPDNNNSREPGGQRTDWLEKLVGETNFTKDTIERLPTYQGNIPELEEIEDSRFLQLKADAGALLLDLLADPDEDVRNVAAHALSVADNPQLQKHIMSVAQDMSAPFDHRLAAFDALANSKNIEVQIFLAKFITTVVSAKSFLSKNKDSDGPIPEVQKSKMDPNQIPIKMLQHQDLLKSAAEGLSEIKDKRVLELFEKFVSKGKFQTFCETVKGITKVEREIHLEAVMLAAKKSITQPTELISKILEAGIRSSNEELRDLALTVASRNPALLTEDDFELLLETTHSWIINQTEPNLVEVGKTILLGEVLSQAKDPEIRLQIRGLLKSHISALRVVALLAMKGTSDPEDIKFLAGAVERSESVLERSIAISGLGDWIKKNPETDRKFAVDLLVKNLLIFEMAEDCKVSIIEALKGVDDKDFVSYCWVLLTEEDYTLAQTAAFALEQDRSPDITDKLVDLIQDTNEEKRYAQGLAADTLAKRRDIIVENDLCEILSSADEDVAIRCVNALKGTDYGPALELLLEIGANQTRHPELRSDAIYAIKISLEQNSGLFGTAFQRKVARTLAHIIANEMEEPEVRQSAINALPEVATSKIVKRLIEIAKSPDIGLPDAAMAKLNKMSYPIIYEAMKSIYAENPVIERKLFAIDKLATQKNSATLEMFLKEARTGDVDIRTKFIESLGNLLKD